MSRSVDRPWSDRVFTWLAGGPACALAAWLASGLYCEVWLLRLFLVLVVTPPALIGLQKHLSGRLLHRSREQFQWFLELLLTELSTGASFEHAYRQAVDGLRHLLHDRSSFLKTLLVLDQHIKARRPTAVLCRSMASRMPCPEAQLFFRLLPDLQATGCPISPFVRQELRHMAEQKNLRDHLTAETTQRRTEAVLLIMMPFLVTSLLQGSWDMGQVAGSAWFAGRLMACCLAFSSALMTLFFLADPTPAVHRNSRSSAPGSLSRLDRLIAGHLIRLYRDRLPTAHGSRVLRILLDQDNRLQLPVPAASDSTSGYFALKGRLMAAALLPALLAAFTQGFIWPWLLVLPLLIGFLQDRMLLQDRSKQEEGYRREFPLVLNLWSALLQTGLSLDRTLSIACQAFNSQTGQPLALFPALEDHLRGIQSRLQAGQPASAALNRLIQLCPVPEIQTALLLLIRYEQLGGTEALQMVDLQALSLWSLHRAATRKHLEQHSLKLLLPMMISLAAVLLSALLPAWASLQTI